MKTMKYSSLSSEETEEIGAKLAQSLSRGDVVAFSGALGAGKTAFSRGVLRGLGYKGAVTSPTFAIANEYETERGRVVHADLYRIADADALYEIGFDEYFDGACIVLLEWSERAQEMLPPRYLSVAISYGAGADSREIAIEEVWK